MDHFLFLRLLEKELHGKLPEIEIKEALDYYRNLFDEAGAEGEARLLHDIGTPQFAASRILKDQAAANDDESGAFESDAWNKDNPDKQQAAAGNSRPSGDEHESCRQTIHETQNSGYSFIKGIRMLRETSIAFSQEGNHSKAILLWILFALLCLLAFIIFRKCLALLATISLINGSLMNVSIITENIINGYGYSLAITLRILGGVSIRLMIAAILMRFGCWWIAAICKGGER